MIDSNIPDSDRMTENSYMGLYSKAEENKSESIKHVKRWEIVERHAPNAETLLDYGSSIGTFAKHCPNSMVISQFDSNWKTGFCDERILDNKYDVLTAWHVIEHLVDPVGFLKRIRHDYLFLIVPWIEYVEEKDLPSWPYFEHGMHLQFFSRKSLNILLKDYEILEENNDDGVLSNLKNPEWIVTMACKRCL
jgi:hypothetical protein